MSLRVHRRPRRYDKIRGCYVYDISFKTVAPLTERTVEVADAFGLGVDDAQEHVLYKDFEVRLAEGDVVYITGDSGSGKSVLLKALQDDLGDEAAVLGELDKLPDEPIIDLVGGSFSEALRLLSMVGLNDAFLFLRKPGELSEGQRYRFKMARLLEQKKRVWLCDEFCSTLDRSTAKIVSFNLQKLARRCAAILVVATTHTDLRRDLNPSIYIRKGWGSEINIEYMETDEAKECSICGDIVISEASKEDYEKLAHLHYRSHRVTAPLRFYAMRHQGELIGVIVYTYPSLSAKGRKQAAGYTPSIEEINREWATVNRVVVHPRYRSIGLGARILRETLRLTGRRHVELIAVMARYNPFGEKAGMRRVLLSEPDKSVVNVVEELRGFGFHPALLASGNHCEQVMSIMSPERLLQFKETLLGVGTCYYRRLARVRKPYLNRGEFREWLGVASVESLAYSLRNLSILAQSKAYLYWCSDWVVRDDS